MANETVLDLEAPVEETPAGTKPWYESQSMWASIATGLVGFLTILGVPQAITGFLQVNLPIAIGAIMTLVGVWGSWAAATRKTTLTTGR